MANVVLQSCDTDQPFTNHNRTVAHTVNLTAIPGIGDTDPFLLTVVRSGHADSAAIWGLPDIASSTAKFETMEAGDLVIFHRKDIAFSYGTLDTKGPSPVDMRSPSPSVAVKLWPPDEYDRHTYPYLFTLIDVHDCSMPLRELSKVAARNLARPLTGTWPYPNFTIADLTKLRSALSTTASRVSRAYESPVTMFISYAHADMNLVDALVSELTKAGVRVRRDSDELRTGDSLIERISHIISEIDFVVAVVSPSSVKSSWCRNELSLAASRGIDEGRVVVLPVRVDDTPMPPALRDKLWTRLTFDSVDRAAASLVRDARLHLAHSEPDSA
jgi:hypothetical protein